MIRAGDAFLMRTATGYAFGAVMAADEARDVAFVVFQNGDRGTAAPSLVQRGMELLASMAVEVRAA